MLSVLNKFRRRPAGAARSYPVVLEAGGPAAGKRALLSYIAAAVAWPDDHPRLQTHSNFWECREIARLLSARGYAVDAIDWDDSAFEPDRPYDLVIDIDANLQRLAPLLPETTVRILHLTGSYGPFQHRAELERVADFEKRTGKLYSPKRLVRWLELAERSLDLAHACSLLGNQVTLDTYPEKYRGKITLIPVSGSPLPEVQPAGEAHPDRREFLWYFGSGAVHKGLDLVLDVFRAHPEWTLHVVGDAPRERDFAAAYGSHLAAPNVRVHGHLAPGDAAFAGKIRNAFCFIAPSCSEGASPAVVTCLQMGLFPILSRQTGVDLPPGCGIYLEELNSASIEKAVRGALALGREEVVRQISACRQMALTAYGRPAFSAAFAEFLRKVLEANQSRDGHST